MRTVARQRLVASATVVILGLAALALRQFGAALDSRPLFDTLASLGLFAVFLVLLDWLIFWVAAGAFNQMFRTGVLLGMLAGAVGGFFYATSAIPGGASDDIPGAVTTCMEPSIPVLYVRVIIFSTLIGAGLHCMVTAGLLMPRHLLGVSKHKRVIAIGVGTFLLGVVATYLGENIHLVGKFVRYITVGAIDWIGSGNCPLLSETNDRGVAFTEISIPQILYLLIAFAIIEFLYLALRSRLRGVHYLRAMAFLGVGAIIVWAAFLLLGPKRDLAGMFAFSAVWLVLASAIFFLQLWASNKGAADALSDAFGDSDAIDKFVRSRFPLKWERLPAGADVGTVAAKLVSVAESAGWLDDVIVAARYVYPTHPGLAAVADSLGLGIDPPDPAALRAAVEEVKLEFRNEAAVAGVIEKLEAYSDAREEIAKFECWICRIEAPKGVPRGTGFLVGRNEVLTNLHVYGPALAAVGHDPTLVYFRFDYRARQGRTIVEGTPYQGAAGKPIASSPYVLDGEREPGAGELDYALVQLAEPAGEMPLGPHGVDGPTGDENAPRGWMTVGPVQKPTPLQMITILQHPDGQPLLPCPGVVTGTNTGDTRIFHTALTLGGSSGSPCLAQMDNSLVGLHDASIPAKDRRRAVPYYLVQSDIERLKRL